MFTDPEKPVIHKIYEIIKITTRQPVNASIGSKITTIPGNKLTLTCNASGLPEPKLMWKRNELLAQAGGSTYQVPALRTSDTGVYTCVASNLAGEVMATSHVIVLGRYLIKKQRRHSWLVRDRRCKRSLVLLSLQCLLYRH